MRTEKEREKKEGNPRAEIRRDEFFIGSREGTNRDPDNDKFCRTRGGLGRLSLIYRCLSEKIRRGKGYSS